jgi:hypothetical protein
MDEPLGDPEVPIADAVDQRRSVGEQRELSEDFQPTETSEIAAAAAPPDEANPADWQEQLTSAETDWDDDVEV